ncbi:hypothetical protein [Nonomuraea sp. NPDC005650]|uniref:hypothetical protein n=1 Tax=Nonomuraea sp. NPDC005650 TaxID=3157045 RepID=UPI0033B76E47
MAGTMTGRAVGAPWERFYSEMRRLRTKAGTISYRRIVKHERNKLGLGLSKTTVAAVFTGSDRKKGPNWANAACVFEILREELAKTGVDPDAHLGTMDQLYQLFLEVTELNVAELDVTGSASAGPPAAQPTADAPPASAGPSPASPGQEADGPEAATVVPFPRVTASPAIPPAVVPAAEPAHATSRPATEEPVMGESATEEPAVEELAMEERATTMPPGQLSPGLPVPGPGLPQEDVVSPLPVAQPVEREAAMALLVARPPGQLTTDRLGQWFGPRGLELEAKAEDRHPMALFELGVLLINRDALLEGLLFLEQAARLDGELRLELPTPHRGDRLCGSIVADICRRVASDYEAAGYQLRQRLWVDYSVKIDAQVPLALLTDARGRHARQGYRLSFLSDLEVQRIKKAYWRSRAVDHSLVGPGGPTGPAPHHRGQQGRPSFENTRWSPFEQVWRAVEGEDYPPLDFYR